MEPLAASPRFRPLTCEKSSAGDYDGMRSPALPHGVGRHSIRCSRRAELRETPVNPLRYNEEGPGRRTVVSETACRTGPAWFT